MPVALSLTVSVPVAFVRYEKKTPPLFVPDDGLMLLPRLDVMYQLTALEMVAESEMLLPAVTEVAPADSVAHAAGAGYGNCYGSRRFPRKCEALRQGGGTRRGDDRQSWRENSCTCAPMRYASLIQR